MSRPLAGALALALIAAIGFAPAPSPLPGGDRAAAAECIWQRHSKRVVKRVKRHGKVRRTVHFKHRWTCNPLAQPPGPALAPAPAPVPGPAQGPTAPEPPPRRVSVKAEEFSFTLSRSYVVAGEVTVELNNQGEDPHNLNLRVDGGSEAPLAVGEAGPDESRVGSFSLAPGRYRLWCDLEQHDEWGMNVELEVRPG